VFIKINTLNKIIYYIRFYDNKIDVKGSYGKNILVSEWVSEWVSDLEAKSNVGSSRYNVLYGLGKYYGCL